MKNIIWEFRSKAWARSLEWTQGVGPRPKFNLPGVGSKGHNILPPESGHCAYQIKGNGA